MPPLKTIVIPCHNEASRLQIPTFLDHLKEHSETCFIFVNDGSTDTTDKLILQIKEQAPEQISLLTLSQNRGKAEAVRQGVLAALKNPTKYIGFWDADLATPLSEIPRFASVLSNNQQMEMVCGARIKRLGAHIDRHWYRHYPGRIIATLISIILQLPTYDTQCGAKLFKRELADKIFARPFLSSWFFDVELIARTIGFSGKRQAAEMICELPLTAWRDVGTSKVSFRYLPMIPVELGRIYLYYRKQLKKQ